MCSHLALVLTTCDGIPRDAYSGKVKPAPQREFHCPLMQQVGLPVFLNAAGKATIITISLFHRAPVLTSRCVLSSASGTDSRTRENLKAERRLFCNQKLSHKSMNNVLIIRSK